jgi:restriction system protein
MTIVEAIRAVLQSQGPLGYREVYKAIIDQGLYKFGAREPESVVNNKLRKHCAGLNFPSASPAKYFVIASQEGKTTKYALNDAPNDGQIVNAVASIASEKIPEEKLLDAYLEHRGTVKQLLLEEILKSEPGFFERLVVDLLIAMGYGGDQPDAGIVKGGSGDAGIDGIIKEDKLGLDKIYIQAKRYATTTVGRPELQQFVGAMEHVQKGVFITTSEFNSNARKYAEKIAKNLVLIDGSLLCDLMINHGVGVSIVKNYSTYKVDSDYFSDN